MSKLMVLVVGVTLIGGAGWGAESVRQVVLAERGRTSDYVIVVPKAPGAAIQYAAEELRDWTEKLTGVRLTIATNVTPAKAVYLGGTEPGLGEDGFRLSVENGQVRVRGSAERGVLYGVYELLETYGGIGWFASWHTVVPQLARFALPATLNDREVPAFELREPFFHDTIWNPEFAARLRKNSARWGKLSAKYGRDRFRYGAELKGHSFGKLLPVERYFDAHPEYFAEVNGKRQRVKPQPCLTNPEVLEVVVSNLLAMAAADPQDCWIYSVSHNDNKTLCQCANCKAVNAEEGSTAGTEVRFVNAVAERLVKVYPDRKVGLLAYETTRHPPKRTRLHPNVVVDLCPIECDFSRPIPESAYAENVQFVKDIKGWSKLTDHLYVFDYVADFNDYFHPYPNLRSLQGNLKFFREHKVRYIFEEGVHNSRHGDFSELKAWVLAKLMWNPDQDFDRLLDRFLAGYYGAAAPFVREYIDALHDLPRDPVKSPLLIMERFNHPAIPDEFLNRSLRWWREAENAVRDDPVYRRHVRLGALSVTMTILQRNAYRLAAMSRPFPDARIRTLARFSLDTIEKLPYSLSLHESGVADLKRLLEQWRRYADPAYVWPPSDRVTAEAEAALTVWAGFQTKPVADPAANGGKALRFSNAFSGDWVAYLPSECFGHDDGATYRLRLRARIDPTATDGEVLDLGLSTPGKSHLRSVKASELGADYRWVEIFDWQPKPNEYVYLGFGRFDKSKWLENPAAKAVWVDQLELVKVSKGK